MKAYVLTGSFLVSDLPKGYLHKVEPGSTIEELEMDEYPERIQYSKDLAVLSSDSDKVQLIPGSVEAIFAEVLFGSPRGEQISWDAIADEVNGLSEEILDKERREATRKKIKDARIRLNEKILTAFGVQDFFVVNKGTYSRK
jgi:hypothetical protein